MPQAPAPVPVRVRQLSGRQLLAASLGPSVTVRQLRAEVDQRLGAGHALHEARLCLGTERLPEDAPVAQLAGPGPGGGAVVLDAVVTRSAEKADGLGREAEELWVKVRSRGWLLREEDFKGLVEKYGAALELAHRANEDVSGDRSLLDALRLLRKLAHGWTPDDARPSQRTIDFLAVSELLRVTRVHLGERRLKDTSGFFLDVFYGLDHPFCAHYTAIIAHDVFTAPLLAAFKDAGFVQLIGSSVIARMAGGPLSPRQAERRALKWLADSFPQAAVREALRELELSLHEQQEDEDEEDEGEDEEDDADADADAAADSPPRESAAARAPGRCARRAHGSPGQRFGRRRS